MTGPDAVVELFKDLEAALAIVRTNSASNLNLTLQKAEVEVELTSTTTAEGGFKFDFGVSLDTSTKRETSSVHVFSLSLEPKAEMGHAGFGETQALASAIYEIVSLHKRLSEKSLYFNVGALNLTVTFEKTVEGKLQVVGGGGKGSGTVQRLKLSFRPSRVG
jgi:hypothetical protein